MTPEPRAVGCVVLFWVICLSAWWLAVNAMSALTWILAAAVFLAVSLLVYGVARAIQELP